MDENEFVTAALCGSVWRNLIFSHKYSSEGKKITIKSLENRKLCIFLIKICRRQHFNKTKIIKSFCTCYPIILLCNGKVSLRYKLNFVRYSIFLFTIESLEKMGQCSIWSAKYTLILEHVSIGQNLYP